MHINGNLRQWAICGLSGTRDSRNREEEFSCDRKISISDLLDLTRETVDRACGAISGVNSATLTESITIQGFDVSRMQAILHTAAHFQGHTHQIILMTRIQLGERYRFEWTPDHPRGDLPM